MALKFYLKSGILPRTYTEWKFHFTDVNVNKKETEKHKNHESKGSVRLYFERITLNDRTGNFSACQPMEPQISEARGNI